MNKQLDEFIDLLCGANHVVAFTGAGISTLSGLADFRGENGLGKTMEPEKIFDIDVFNRDPSFFYKYARELVFDLDRIKPSIVHLELARLERLGIVKSVITQNIDMLHQRGGSGRVIEVHGSAETCHCYFCGKKYSYKEIVPVVMAENVPYCSSCKGAIKPDITFYGESLPEKAFMEAAEESVRADLMLVLGSSLVVYPAASFVDQNLGSGGKLVIVNNQATPYDRYADFLFKDLGDFFNKIRDAVK